MRSRILDACVDAFRVTGFHGATMKEVAQRAGISQTALTHHFPTKADLLLAVLVTRYAQSAEVLEKAQEDSLLAAHAAVIRDNTENPGLLQLHSVVEAEATSPSHPAHDYYLTRFADYRTALILAFEELRDDGRLRAPISPDILANQYIALLDGLQLQWLYDAGSVDIEEHIRLYLQAVADIEL